MQMTQDEIEMLKFFCIRLLNDFHNPITYNMPFLKFIFRDSDYEEILSYLETLKNQGDSIRIQIKTHCSERNVLSSTIAESIQIMTETRDEYLHYRDENSIYIEVPNYQNFFSLLNELMNTFEEKSGVNNFFATELLRSVWLRMSPSDITDVERFLKRQISFIKNDYLLSSNETELQQIGDLSVAYFNHGNEAWFESNRHIRPVIRRKTSEICNDKWGTIDFYSYYHLPVIHYSLIKENEEATCYIFGLQSLGEITRDEIIGETIQEEKKRLRNKYVSADFIIALKIFIDLLQEIGITSIKVPLLQVFNYPYHQKLGETYSEQLSHYSAERIQDLENANTGEAEYELREYRYLQENYKRFFGTEDRISANKTERLVHTFYLVAEKYGNLEIITEPFVESDYLLCKISKQKKKIH